MALDQASQTSAGRPSHLDTLIARRFAAPGPKRILALDGGGTRGIVTLAFLARVETMLRDKLQRPKLVLADYFDLIGGTSVGSLLATMLALGHEVATVRKEFETWAPKVFWRLPWSSGRIGVSRGDRRLSQLIYTQVSNLTLKTDRLRTGLCIVTKRLDTGSVWPVINNPADPYFLGGATEHDGSVLLGNGDYALYDLVRASTAAPTYFSPRRIHVYSKFSQGLFVDGGVSPYNNPALLLFMLAGQSGYNLGGGSLEPLGEREPWELGEDNLLMISIGTGSFRHRVHGASAATFEAIDALQGMIADGQQLGLTMLQWMSMPKRDWWIDSAAGDLSLDLLGDKLGLKKPLLSFQRYDVRLDSDWLAHEDNCGVSLSPDVIHSLRDFTNYKAIRLLGEIADIAAGKQVSPEHFPAGFDAVWNPAS